MNQPEPFQIAIPEDEVADLRERVRRARIPPDLANGDGSYGIQADYLRSLLETWRGDYDWFAAQRRMNDYNHFRVTVDGVPIHYMHINGTGPNPRPLILSHGWPWTFWDMQKVIGPLTDPAAHGGDPADAFELIVPSLPGFGFSVPAQAGINFWKTADLWQRLMTEVLGFERYFAAGADWGNLVTQQLGHKYAGSVAGIFLTNTTPPDLFNSEQFWDISNRFLSNDLPPEQRKGWLDILQHRVPHVAVQTIEPQTMAYGLNDSPAGLLAWLLQPRIDWGHWEGSIENAFPREHILTTASIYWFTQTYVSSARYYADAVRHPWVPAHDRTPLVEAPVCIGFLGGEFYPGMTVENRVELFTRSPLAANYSLHRARAHPRGGHFAYYEVPEYCIDDIREGFRALS